MKHLYISQNMEQIKVWNITGKIICWTPNVCMYICMYVCTYVCIYVCITHVCMYVCMYVHMYVCIYVCMYVCMSLLFPNNSMRAALAWRAQFLCTLWFSAINKVVGRTSEVGVTIVCSMQGSRYQYWWIFEFYPGYRQYFLRYSWFSSLFPEGLCNTFQHATIDSFKILALLPIPVTRLRSYNWESILMFIIHRLKTAIKSEACPLACH